MSFCISLCVLLCVFYFLLFVLHSCVLNWWWWWWLVAPALIVAQRRMRRDARAAAHAAAAAAPARRIVSVIPGVPTSYISSHWHAHSTTEQTVSHCNLLNWCTALLSNSSGCGLVFAATTYSASTSCVSKQLTKACPEFFCTTQSIIPRLLPSVSNT